MAKNSKQDDKKKKKKGHPVRNSLIVLLILSMFGGGFGLWRFGGYDWGYQETKETTAESEKSEEVTTTVEDTTESSSTVEETTASSIILIEVSDSQIKIGDDTFDDDAKLKNHLMSIYDEDKEIELIDDKAVKSAYDMAKSVLDDLGYKYKESTR